MTEHDQSSTAIMPTERRCGCGCGGTVQSVGGRWRALGFIDMVTLRCTGCQCVWAECENGSRETDR